MYLEHRQDHLGPSGLDGDGAQSGDRGAALRLSFLSSKDSASRLLPLSTCLCVVSGRHGDPVGSGGACSSLTACYNETCLNFLLLSFEEGHVEDVTPTVPPSAFVKVWARTTAEPVSATGLHHLQSRSSTKTEHE